MPELYEDEHTEVLHRIAWARKRPSLAWLVGAAMSFTAAAAITMYAPATRTIDGETTRALEREAAELGRTVDLAAHAAHERAGSIANTAIMRAAILTDAATVADMIKSEFTLELAPGEVVELFQIHGAKREMLIRLPASAALPEVEDRDVTIVQLDEAGPRVVVAAHVDRLRDGAGYDATMTGLFVLSTPVDVAAIRRRLSENVVDATLAESGKSVQLVHRSSATVGELIRLAVPSRIADLTLTVAPVRHSARWVGPARQAAFGLGALMLIVFAASFALRRPTPRRTSRRS